MFSAQGSEFRVQGSEFRVRINSPYRFIISIISIELSTLNPLTNSGL